MTFLAKPAVAIVYGAFFCCAATCVHFDEIATSPLSLAPDWTASAVLVGGAIVSRRDWREGRTFQVAAWAFMVSLLFHSFLGNLELWLAGEGLPGLYLGAVGVLLVRAGGRLVASIKTRRI
jgi:hypothetical protein